MFKSSRLVLSLTSVAVLLSSRSAGAVPCASWKDADQALRKAWAAGYPNEKIITLEANGEPDVYEKVKPTGDTKVDEHGNTWEFYAKHKFCRIPAKAVVEQGANKRSFSVSAIYRVEGKQFVFQDIGVGESTVVASSGQEAPSKDDIKKMISDYWLTLHPKTQVEKVATSAAELKTDSKKGRWWYSTGADIFVVNEDGKKQKCSNDFTTVYRGEKGKEGVDASGTWKVYFLDTPSCR